MGASNSVLNYPETGYGYVPDSGSIYTLSRFPGEIGTFLALTGYNIRGADLKYDIF